MVAKQIEKRGARVRHLLVNTRNDNHARQMYERTIGAKVIATISGMFTADDLFMAANNVNVDSSAETYEINHIIQ